MHLTQVVVTDGTQAAVAAAQVAGRSCWRVSSTLFSHIASDVTLQPLEPFKTAAAAQQYPPVKAGEQVGCVVSVESASIPRPGEGDRSCTAAMNGAARNQQKHTVVPTKSYAL